MQLIKKLDDTSFCSVCKDLFLICPSINLLIKLKDDYEIFGISYLYQIRKF